MSHDRFCPVNTSDDKGCMYCTAIKAARKEERLLVYAEQSTSDGWVTAQQLISYEDIIREKALNEAADKTLDLLSSVTLTQELWENAPALCPECGPRVWRWVTIACETVANQIRKTI